MLHFKLRTPLLVLLSLLLFAFKGDKPAYRIHNTKGKVVDYEQLLKAAKDADVVFFGELHNNPISHWLQLELTKDLHATKGDKPVLGAEMFEADNQLILNEYLAGNISQSSFEQECRLWPNYTTDYKPLVEYAKENNLRFVASNIPRRYASLVYREGLEGLEKLSNDAKKTIAPLPIEVDLSLECYASMMVMAEGHGGENLPKAQAVKDATMGWFIAQNRQAGETLLHYNGAYHSDNWESTVWYLDKYAPGSKILTITSVLEDDPDSLSKDNAGKAEFTICVAADMTVTH